MRNESRDAGGGWANSLIDPVLTQAEHVFSHRQARYQMFDPELLGEPAWDILLCAFIADGKSERCQVEELANDLHLSHSDARSWIERLAKRELIEDYGSTIGITPRGETSMRALFTVHVREMKAQFGVGDGLLQFSSSSVSDGD